MTRINEGSVLPALHIHVYPEVECLSRRASPHRHTLTPERL